MTDMLFLFVIKQNTEFFWTLHKKKEKTVTYKFTFK